MQPHRTGQPGQPGPHDDHAIGHLPTPEFRYGRNPSLTMPAADRATPGSPLGTHVRSRLHHAQQASRATNAPSALCPAILRILRGNSNLTGTPSHADEFANGPLAGPVPDGQRHLQDWFGLGAARTRAATSPAELAKRGDGPAGGASTPFRL
ncbi:hypothetical protein GCM10009527_029040 [Actinomadura nitritigenes]